MRRDRDDPIDAATAERLLAGDVVGPRRLVDLLSQATARPRKSELAGEDAAVAAFRTARFGTTHPARHRHPAPSAWARLVTVKAGAIALALAVTGVALAAGTGILPSPLPGTAPAKSSPSIPASTALASTAAGDDRGSGSGQVDIMPSPLLEGLCRAYFAQVDTNPNKILESPKFAVLVEAAGGIDQVRQFCDNLTHVASPGTDTGPRKSDDHPTGPPTSRPSPHARAVTRASRPAP
jgi:hypothetical protein